MLYQGLTDRVFFCAPGAWTLYRCEGCASGYLDPRPTRETVTLAYSTYCTHSVPAAVVQPLSERLKLVLKNGYRNFRFGTHAKPASSLGIIAALLLPKKRAALEAEGRHLPRAWPGARLLDVGCGNGVFLDFARRAGWQTTGIDLDPKAVETARAFGLDVRLGSIETLDPSQEQFDGITLSHVIEHVHSPAELLTACWRLLRPGGWIWIETPNLDAYGHQLYASNWLGLDPPRHLVLFSRLALFGLVQKTGFVGARDQQYWPVCGFSFSMSENIALGVDPWREENRSREMRQRAHRADTRAWRDCAQREYITLKAWKPAPSTAGFGGT